MSRYARAAWFAGLLGVLLLTPAPVLPQTAGTERGLMWQVERGGRVGWLVGSIHVLTPDYYPLPERIEGAFEGATTLMQELAIEEMQSPQAMALLMARGLAADADTLDALLPAETWALVKARVTRADLPVEMIRRMRPWLAALTLFSLELQRAGFDPEYGIDMHFRRKLDGTAKTFRALETAAEQIEYLANLDPEVQIAWLQAYIEDADAQIAAVKELAEAWRGGDAPTLERLLLESMKESPQVYESLLVARNRRWMPAIESCLQQERCFIVVGAGHMIGPDGLVAMLRQKGYTITQR